MDGNRKITADMLSACGPVVRTIYRQMYPRGLTLAELRELAESRGWMRRVLLSMEEGE